MKRHLTWAPNWSKRGGGGRWKKQIGGKVHFFGHGKSRTDAQSYRLAVKRYFEFVKEMEASAPVEVKTAKATVSQVCEKFLQSLQGRYDRQEISSSYFEQIHGGLKEFTAFIGGTSRFNCISEIELDDYRSHTLNCPVSRRTYKPISLTTAKDRLAVVKTLFRWAYKLHLLENLPRNMMDYTNYPWPKASVRVFTMDELKTLWTAANARIRCWIALGMNCGLGQNEIAQLRMSEVDWQRGYIERERSKTGVKAKYKLWDLTLRLMNEQKSPDATGDDLVFLTEDQTPLVQRMLVGGKFTKSDAIKCAFWRIQMKTGINSGRGFYCFRKTGATLIEQIDPSATEMYLSHAELGMKRNYADRDWGRLERALVKMERRLNGVID